MPDDDISYEMDPSSRPPKKKQKKVVDLLSSDDDNKRAEESYQESNNSSSSEESSEFKELWEDDEELETEIATHIEEQSQHQQQANNLLCTQPAVPPPPVAAATKQPSVTKIQRTPGVPKVVVPIKGSTPESLAMSSATQSYRTTTTDPTWTMQQVSKSKSTSPHVGSVMHSKPTATKQAESEMIMPKPAKVSLSPRKANSKQKAKSSQVVSSLEAVGDVTTTNNKASSKQNKSKEKSSAKETEASNEKDSKPAAEKAPPSETKEKKKDATRSESKKRSATSSKDDSKKKKAKVSDSNAAGKPKSEETAQAAQPVKKPTSSDESAKASKQPAAAAVKKPDAPRRKKRTFQDQVLLHMLLECKPFTLKTLANSLNTTETALNFVMLSLVDKRLVIKKEFQGKKSTKELYWANQNSNAKEIKALQLSADDMKQAAEELRELKRRDAELTKELAAVSQELSNEELDAQLKESEQIVEGLKRQVAETKQRIKSQNAAPAAAKKGFGPPKSAALLARERCPRRMKMRINAMRGEWKKRKEQCMDFVETLADGLEKKPKDVVKMLELETDEMEGVTMPPKHEVDG